MERMSTYREDVAELISAQIEKALEKEYDRGWNECMQYYWSKREIKEDDRIERVFQKSPAYEEDGDPYAG